MKIHLHKNATTTPAQRAFIQENPHLSVAVLAEKIGVSKTTVRRWRNRSNVFDRSHAPKRVKTALTPVEEIKIVICRLATRAGLDDLHGIVDAFLGIGCSRASLNRCLKRYQISRMPALRRSVPLDLGDYTGTWFYYTCFHLPGLSDSGSSVLLHTLLDCSFRTFYADITHSGPEFLTRVIRRSPINVLGIIHEGPVVLVPGNDSAGLIEVQASYVQRQCAKARLVAHHLPAQHPETVEKLRKTCASLGSSAPVSWDFPWGSPDDVARHLDQYNLEFSLGALKQKTPRQAMAIHYTHFPGSFRQKPEAAELMN